MTAAIEALLAPSPQRANLAQAAALAGDGAIVQAQFATTPDPALHSLAGVNAGQDPTLFAGEVADLILG